MELYCIDTSSLIEGWRRLYPPDLILTLWDKDIPELIANGHLKATDEVMKELDKKDDEVLKWAKSNSGMFIPIDVPTQNQVRYILSRYPKLVEARGKKTSADVFVIALAQLLGAKVISEEKLSPGQNKLNIPLVCRELGIPCINLLSLMREMGWKYIRQ